MAKNKKTRPDDYDRFIADTRLTAHDVLGEYAMLAILWDDLGLNKDAEIALKENEQLAMLTVPFVFKIRERLEKEGRWPAERNLQNCTYLSSLLILKASQMPPALVARARELGYKLMEEKELCAAN